MNAIAHTMLIGAALLVAVPLSAQTDSTSNPRSLDPRVEVRPLMRVQTGAVRIDIDARNGRLYYLLLDGSVYEIDTATWTERLKYTTEDHGISSAAGLAIGADGTMYIVGNQYENDSVALRLVRGVPSGDSLVFSVVARSEPYPLNFHYNHTFNAIAIDPSGNYLYVNSGARTDHGEAEYSDGPLAGLRDVPLTAKILRIPVDAQDLYLPDDLDSLNALGAIFAEGVRNPYDMAFAPNGDLFEVENCSDRDDPEEMNWLRQGEHYGFPWRMGLDDNPQQFAGYDPASDPFINPGSFALQHGFFHDDAGFPARPDIPFVRPVVNLGPDADMMRDSTGAIIDASETGHVITTFTPHRSPLGLVFAADASIDSTYRGNAFVLSWNDSSDALLKPFGEPGEDMLRVELGKVGLVYTAHVYRMVEEFVHPIDAVMVGNRILVLELNDHPRLYEVTLPKAPTVSVPQAREDVPELRAMGYGDEIHVEYSGFRAGGATLQVVDVLGRTVARRRIEAVRGTVSVRVPASGQYFVSIAPGQAIRVSVEK